MNHERNFFLMAEMLHGLTESIYSVRLTRMLGGFDQINVFNFFSLFADRSFARNSIIWSENALQFLRFREITFREVHLQ